MDLLAALLVRARRRRLGGSPAAAAGPDLGRPGPGGRCCCRSRSRSSLGTLALCAAPRSSPRLRRVLTTFFDAADNAYLPTIVERERLLEANSALAASGSVAEFAGFGISGILVQLLTGPITIVINAVTYLVSAVLLLTVRHTEAPPPPREDREPVLDEIRQGLRLVRHDPVLRAFAWRPDAHVDAVGRLRGDRGSCSRSTSSASARRSSASSPGSVARRRSSAPSWRRGRRVAGGSGRWRSPPMLLAALGNLFIPLAPAGLPLIAVACLVAQQLIADSAITVYDVTETSVRQALVADRELGRVASTVPGPVGGSPARGDHRRRAARRGHRVAGDLVPRPAGRARWPARSCTGRRSAA